MYTTQHFYNNPHQYPDVASMVDIYLALLIASRASSVLGMGQFSLIVALLMFLKSITSLQASVFFYIVLTTP